MYQVHNRTWTIMSCLIINSKLNLTQKTNILIKNEQKFITSKIIICYFYINFKLVINYNVCIKV